MSRKNKDASAQFVKAMEGCEKFEDSDLQDRLNPTILLVEKDDSYSTGRKLKIFALISSLSNCTEKERRKYVKKISGLL